MKLSLCIPYLCITVSLTRYCFKYKIFSPLCMFSLQQRALVLDYLWCTVFSLRLICLHWLSPALTCFWSQRKQGGGDVANELTWLLLAFSTMLSPGSIVFTVDIPRELHDVLPPHATLHPKISQDCLQNLPVLGGQWKRTNWDLSYTRWKCYRLVVNTRIGVHYAACSECVTLLLKERDCNLEILLDA